MRTHRRTLASAALIAVTVVGGVSACGDSDSGTVRTDAGSSGSPSTGPSSLPTTTSTPDDRMTGALPAVTLQRVGGLAGVKDVLELRPDGSYTVTSKGQRPVTRQLSEAQQSAIVQALAEADLPNATPSPSPTQVMSDQFSYVVTAQGHTLRASETTLPESARPLLSALGDLFSAPAPTP